MSSRISTPSHFFVFVVVRVADRLLVVHEAKHGQRWYAPAGGVEPGESLAEAAVRETMEEAGVLVRPLGIAGVEHKWTAPSSGGPLGAWWRYIVVAEPVTPPGPAFASPKRSPDEHTLEARWVTRAELARLPLRHPEVLGAFDLPLDVPRVPMASEAALPMPAPRPLSS